MHKDEVTTSSRNDGNTVLAAGQRTCPKCGSDWDGGSILETFIKQREEGVKCWQGKSDEQIEKEMKEKNEEKKELEKIMFLFIEDFHLKTIEFGINDDEQR